MIASRKTLAAGVAVMLTVLLGWSAPVQAATSPPTPRETLLNYLYGYANGRTVSGMHHKWEVYGADRTDWPTYWDDQIFAVTGERPGLWGGDFTWYKDPADLVGPAEAAWKAGQLVTLSWHSCRPKVPRTTKCDKSATSGTPNEKLTEAEWTEVLTEGTPLNTSWYQDLDKVADALAQLRDHGVGVLWRPLHEINSAWAWWGGHPQSYRLYEMMRTHFDARGLTNLVWVWNVTDQDPERFPDYPEQFADYLPGDAYVDVLSLDVWNKGYADGNDEPSTVDYTTLVNLAKGRPVALGEVKKVPSPALLARQPRWSWFMLWPDPLENQPEINTPAVLRATYQAPAVFNLGDLNRPVPDPALGADLAQSRPIWAKTSENTWLDARWAVDGNSRTRWSSTYADSQWIYLQLARPTVVRKIRLDWEAAYARKFQVQVSADGTTWRNACPDQAGVPGVQIVQLDDTQPVHYVKIYAWERATNYGYSLWSLNVYA
ncbi:glycosyl hydrolase [Actinoplanes flavus]|uniref:Discoidin domain-containing protein n=1 Tax=Actinoplanes flavus TaxID=2820290 RepID=A0ABS3UZ83_9ACTN|nr:glycosyl hydrolase [Actinoplanes flavus]MBO3743897.1 discoidin domain-containing protein [Actinoplanes flavus]